MIPLITQYCPSCPHKSNFKLNKAFSMILLSQDPQVYTTRYMLSQINMLYQLPTAALLEWNSTLSLRSFHFRDVWQCSAYQSIEQFSSETLTEAVLEQVSCVLRMHGIATSQVWQNVTMTIRGTPRTELISSEFIQYEPYAFNHLTFIVPTAESEAAYDLWKFCKRNKDIYSLRTHSITR